MGSADSFCCSQSYLSGASAPSSLSPEHSPMRTEPELTKIFSFSTTRTGSDFLIHFNGVCRQFLLQEYLECWLEFSPPPSRVSVTTMHAPASLVLRPRQCTPSTGASAWREWAASWRGCGGQATGQPATARTSGPSASPRWALGGWFSGAPW